MYCGQQVFRVRQLVCKSFALMSPSSTKHNTYLHVSAPKPKDQWSHMLILVQNAKTHSIVSNSGLHLGESNLPLPHLKSKSPFLSLHPARTQTVNSAAILPSHQVTTHHFNTVLRQSKAVVWSNPYGIRGPEPPSHLKRVICYHNIL